MQQFMRTLYWDKVRTKTEPAEAGYQNCFSSQACLMKQRQSEMEANTSALKNVYARFTPEQKAVADQRFGGFGRDENAGYGRGYRGGPRAGSR